MPSSRTILIVEQNRRNTELISGFLSSDGYDVISAATLEELDVLLKAPGEIGLVLIDLVGFDQEIWQRSETLRAEGIPFILISPIKASPPRRGERALLLKPLGVKEMLSIVSTILQESCNE